jgi:3',5'-cyclic AMP phosphodiesterase CpdA
MKAAWLTDVHFDYNDWTDDLLNDYFKELAAQDFDVLIVTGDIGTSTTSWSYIQRLKTCCKKLYYVLGNHDFWDSHIHTVRNFYALKDPCYLTNGQIFQLANDVWILGHDGWYDARSGNLYTSRIGVNDTSYIDDFKDLPLPALELRFKELAKESAEEICKGVVQAIDEKRAKTLVIVTHFPISDLCTRFGRDIDRDWAPWTINTTLGLELFALAEKYPEVQFDVLCGHCHIASDTRLLPNLRVRVGEADYGEGRINWIFDPETEYS